LRASFGSRPLELVRWVSAFGSRRRLGPAEWQAEWQAQWQAQWQDRASGDCNRAALLLLLEITHTHTHTHTDWVLETHERERERENTSSHNTTNTLIVIQYPASSWLPLRRLERAKRQEFRPIVWLTSQQRAQMSPHARWPSAAKWCKEAAWCSKLAS